MSSNRLILLRGLPGSGKSTFARFVYSLSDNILQREADVWFEIFNDGKFDPKKLGRAHQWCQEETLRCLKAGFTVIVSNTFTQEWEMEPYLKMAEELGIMAHVLTMNNHHGNKSVHNVPDETMQKMRQRFVPMI